MNRERLAILADAVENLYSTSHTFCMTDFYISGGIASYCPIGLATTKIPAFTAQGLRWAKDINNAARPEPRYKDFMNFEAAKAFFEIDQDQLEFLFYPQSYPAPVDQKMVAARIRGFIETPDDECSAFLAKFQVAKPAASQVTPELETTEDK